ncbi:MAG: hypothetical protein ABIP94_25865 [Planctomycetota bacterium]
MVDACVLRGVFVAMVVCFGVAMPAQTPPPGEVITLPADLRAALQELSVQPPPANGIPVTVVDDATGNVVPHAMVFVLDTTKLSAVMPRIPRDGPDLERGMLAPLLFAGTRFAAGVDGVAIVPKSELAPMVYAVTADGFGFASPGRAGAEAGALEVRVTAVRTFVVRVVSAKGKPVLGVPIEFGPYGEHGLDRFEPMLVHPSDARGEVRFRMPGLMANMFQGNKGALSAQITPIGCAPVRRAIHDTAADGRIELALPSLGKVLVRLYDEHEQPRAGLDVVVLQPFGDASFRGPLSPLASASKPQQLTNDSARFDFVALGQRFTAKVGGAGISGVVEHTQEGPTRDGELVVFGVRVVDSSPMLSLRLLGVDGVVLVQRALSVLFTRDGELTMSREVSTGDDGRLLLALPE